MNQEKINRINELYKKQKAGTITPEEIRRITSSMKSSWHLRKTRSNS